jgi:hypothetical protein
MLVCVKVLYVLSLYLIIVSNDFFCRLRSKLTMRQQQMDDRRRQNMNNEYGRGGAAPAQDDGDDA